MKHLIIACLLLTVVLSSCGGGTPTAQPIAESQTRAAATLAAQATAATPVPTDTLAPSSTLTLTPTETPELTPTTSATKPPKPTKTPKPKFFSGCFTPNGVKGRTAPFKLEAHTNRRVVVYINGTSRNGNYPIYCSYIVRQGVPIILTLMWGDYTYMIQVGGRGTLNGSFFINDDDKATMRIYEDRVQIGPFP